MLHSNSSKYGGPLTFIITTSVVLECMPLFFSYAMSPCPQGALYCLLGNHSGVCLANLHDWECITLTWPGIVRSGLSSAMSLEKPSIVRLFDDLADKIHRQYETIGIDFSVRKTSSLTQFLLTVIETPMLCLEIGLKLTNNLHKYIIKLKFCTKFKIQSHEFTNNYDLGFVNEYKWAI